MGIVRLVGNADRHEDCFFVGGTQTTVWSEGVKVVFVTVI
jgi:hypothetical protein